MLLPLLIAFVSIVLGTALALLPREGTRIIAPIRIVALVAALAVIGTHLLPEALAELGLLALVAFAAGMAFPWLLDLAGTFFGRGRDGATPLATLEVSYVGLLLHRFGDGLSMGAIARASEKPMAALAVLLALAAHIVPVTTVMVLAFVGLRGRRSAIVRAAGLAAVTMGGVLVAGLALGGSGGPKDVSPWISAVVAGLLLHLVLPSLPFPGKRAHAQAPRRREET